MSSSVRSWRQCCGRWVCSWAVPTGPQHASHALASLLWDALLQLSDSTAAIRKRATSCLGNLAVVLPDSLLQSMVETLLSAIARLRKSGDDQVRTFVQTIGTISRQVGHRLGRHLSTIVPLFIGFMGNPDDESLHTDEANELRENCLQAFESFVLCCPAEATPLATTN